jgi:hypothetical protein
MSVAALLAAPLTTETKTATKTENRERKPVAEGMLRFRGLPTAKKTSLLTAPPLNFISMYR